jgi:hypothetical protein
VTRSCSGVSRQASSSRSTGFFGIAGLPAG